MKNHNHQSRTLITGGADFLGSHLGEQLLNEGHDILCLDNFFVGTMDNTAHLLDHPHFQLKLNDLAYPLFDEVDEIYTLSCPASPILSVRPSAHHQDLRAWHDQYAGTSQSYQDLVRALLEWAPEVTLEGELKPAISFFLIRCLRRMT